MYSQAEAAHLRQAFWTALGQYMAPVPSAEGALIQWINYKTGVKGISFRLTVEGDAARIALALSHPDPTLRARHWQQLLALRPLLHAALGEAWTWEPAAPNGPPLSQVYQELPGVRVLRRDDWPALIAFFKPRLVALDAFWSEAQAAFEGLE